MKVNELSVAKVGSNLTVTYKIKSIVANPDGGVEVYGESGNGAEVRIYASSAAAADLDVKVSGTGGSGTATT